jgi:hypothetical protein
LPLADSHATAVETAAHNPALLHHFADEQQQKDAASLGMWLFLVTEIMFFGGMFCAYLVYRVAHFNAFAAGSQQLSIGLGAFNTAVLLVSSLTVVLAVNAAQRGKRNQLIIYLVLTVVLGLTFLGVKAVEYAEKFEKHQFRIHGVLRRQRQAHPGQPEGGRAVLLPLFRHDRYARFAHDHRVRLVQRLDRARLEGTLHARILHADRKRRPVLALGGYHLDLSVPLALLDQPPLVKPGIENEGNDY